MFKGIYAYEHLSQRTVCVCVCVCVCDLSKLHIITMLKTEKYMSNVNDAFAESEKMK